MKRKRTKRVLLGLVILWAAAFVAVGYAVIGVGFYALVTRRTPWDASREEMIAQGEQIVAAVKSYHAAHGRYPKNLSEADLDPKHYRDCSYWPNDWNGYYLTVSSGPDQWEYDRKSRTWGWEPGPMSGG